MWTIKVVQISFLCLFWTTIVACGRFEAAKPTFVDPELQPYFDRYVEYKLEYLGTDRTRAIDIFFESLPGNAIGKCTLYSSGEREIRIDPDFWAFNSDADRELLMMHELGHCDLNLDHSPPRSIMEVFHIGGYNYSRSLDYYLKQFFSLRVTISPVTLATKHINCNHREK